MSIIVLEFTFKSLLDSSRKNFSFRGGIALLKIVPTGAVIHSLILKKDFLVKICKISLAIASAVIMAGSTFAIAPAHAAHTPEEYGR
ncbi:hypothetical protein ACFLIN_05685 [Corynebacterium kutscheri]|uniref:Uncharacterized protein n=1 Tax=Corynebacterium kutscheri TaxID=35755 RepID=A0A0F6TC10_9CORY|nr:hypothetical protein [Corynebacterium kutscheri]AKE40441.1 hypothetical protein UL82_01045 [Corynebacterium kutscheri]VEH05204.1 Uncharacterised protein [Corynebacterium kutscheri]VEH10834.1 Uncharacterised protein [Corynebacterium kutscheri]